MRTHRLIFNSPQLTDTTIVLDDDDMHYLTRVRRCRIGDELMVIDSGKMCFTGCISEIEKHAITVESWSSDPISEKNFPHIMLAQCLPKTDKMTTVLKSGTEFGIDQFIPLSSDRTEFKGSHKEEKLLTRWRAICKNSAQQAFRTSLPKIASISSLSSFSQALDDDTLIKLVCWEEETSQHISALAKASQWSLSDRFLIVIGPEGGLSQEEVSTLQNQGFMSCHLGPHVFRTEHAGFAAANQLYATLVS